MADWRQDEPGKRPSKAPKPAKKKADPKIPTGPKPTGGWRRGNSPASPKPVGGPSATRSWTGATEAAQYSSFALRRAVVAGVLLTTTVVLFGLLVFYLFYKPKPLPLFVFSVGPYTAPEMLENPFGGEQRSQLQSVNEDNVDTFLDVKNDNDNALSALGTDGWLSEFRDFKESTIGGGGPSKKFVAFYLSAFATISPDGAMTIYSQGESPFGGSAGSSGVPLAAALENIAKSLRPGALAWVILDLQTPPIVTDLGNLDAPWQSATELALSQLSEELQQRLLITLPCKDGQQNWLAPEFSSSFFGYYIRQLLNGRFAETSLLDRDLTLAKFSELLGAKVTNEVSNRRFARQEPVWLPAESFQKAQSLVLVRMDTQRAELAPQPGVDAAQLDRIDDQWDRLRRFEYDRAYRWDPHGYARVESQLLALEDVALYQPAALDKATELVATALTKLAKPTIEYRVSLIEDQHRSRFFRGTGAVDSVVQIASALAGNLAKSSESYPSFWMPASVEPSNAPPGEAATDAPAKASAPPADTRIATADRPRFVWQLYLECARQDRRVWEEAFRLERLQAGLAFGQSAESWIELYLLRRFVEDVDWNNYAAERSEACARALVVFQQLQSLATSPEPELAWWLSTSLKPIEEQYLRGFDRLLANQYVEAIREFKQVATQLEPLSVSASELAARIDALQDALHAIPHLLGWLMREYQFAPQQDTPQLLRRLSDLGNLVNVVDRSYQDLGRRPSGAFSQQSAEADRTVREQLEAFKSEFRDYAQTRTKLSSLGAAGNSPETFRRERIALLSPFLEDAARKALHAQTRGYLQGSAKENLKQENRNLPFARPASEAAAAFLQTIDTQRERWGALAGQDVRLQLEQMLTAESQPSLAEPLQLRTDLLKIEFWQRVFASNFGHSPSLHARLANEDPNGVSWPWTAAWQRWSLAAAKQQTFQVERLAEASWGNGWYDARTLPEKFYFRQLASNYALSRQFANLDPIGQLAHDFETQMDSAIDRSVARLKSLRPQFGGPGQTIALSGLQAVPVTVEGEQWPAVADVFMRVPPSSRRLPVLVADLNQDRRPQTFNFEASHWSNPSGKPTGTLAIRGNYRTDVIDWRPLPKQQQVVELNLVQDPAGDATIRVFPPDRALPITVLLLIDCSNSMDTLVPAEVPNRPKIPLFELVKKNVRGVLAEFLEMHRLGEADVQVGLMPFGLIESRFQSKPNLGQLIRFEGSNVYSPASIQPLTPAWANELGNSLDLLEPSGDTPLYDAILLATQEANKRPKQKTLIFVFSDGVHNVDPDDANTLRKPATWERVRDAVKGDSNFRLSIFFFDFFEDWLKQPKPMQNETHWRGIQKRGLEELDKLEQGLSKDLFDYQKESDPNQLLQAAIKSIERPKFRIISTDNAAGAEFDSGPQPLNALVTLPRRFMPAKLDVNVDGPFGAADSQVNVFGGEELGLYFTTGLRPQLKFPDYRVSGSRPDRDRGGNLASKLDLGLVTHLLPSGELGFMLRFYNSDSRQFTRRPNLIVAEASQSLDREGQRFILADHRFSKTHFPEARLSDVPWPVKRPAARLRVWAADTLPSQLELKTIEPGQVLKMTLGQATVEYGNRGGKVYANVTYASTPPAPTDRVVVICPDFAESKRSFMQDTFAESHEFTLPEGLQNQSVQLRMTTIRGLELAAEANQVTQFDFEQIPLQ